MKNDVLVHGMVECETIYLLIMDSEPSSTALTLNITRQRETQPGGAKGVDEQMCNQCKTYYVTNEKFQSPGRKSGVGNNRAKRINFMAGDDK
jgi:hypothetical protein